MPPDIYSNNVSVTPSFYGAVGDGITNDSGAITTALIKAKSFEKTLELAGKKYYTPNVIYTLPLNLKCIKGQGSQSILVARLKSENYNLEINSGYDSVDKTNNLTVENFLLQGSKTNIVYNLDDAGFTWVGSGLIIKNFWLTNFAGDGMLLAGSPAPGPTQYLEELKNFGTVGEHDLDSVYSSNNNGSGIIIIGVNDSTYRRLFAVGNKKWGIEVKSINANNQKSGAMKLQGGHVYLNDGGGVRVGETVGDGASVDIEGMEIETLTGDSLLLDVSSSDCLIRGCNVFQSEKCALRILSNNHNIQGGKFGRAKLGLKIGSKTISVANCSIKTLFRVENRLEGGLTFPLVGINTDQPNYINANFNWDSEMRRTDASTSTLSIISRSRTSNLATIKFATAHNFGEGAMASVTSAGGTGYDLANVFMSVVDTLTLTYPCVGADEALTVISGLLTFEKYQFWAGPTNPLAGNSFGRLICYTAGNPIPVIFQSEDSKSKTYLNTAYGEFSGQPTTTVSSVTNKVWALPLDIMTRTLADAVGWINGGIVAGNVNFGIYKIADVNKNSNFYNLAGSTLVATGAVAQAGTSSVQTGVFATPVSLLPGKYFLAWQSDNNTAQYLGHPNIPAFAGAVWSSTESSFVLPVIAPAGAGASTDSAPALKLRTITNFI